MPFRDMYPITMVTSDSTAHSWGPKVCAILRNLLRRLNAASTISPNLDGSETWLSEQAGVLIHAISCEWMYNGRINGTSPVGESLGHSTFIKRIERIGPECRGESGGKRFFDGKCRRVGTSCFWPAKSGSGSSEWSDYPNPGQEAVSGPEKSPIPALVTPCRDRPPSINW